MLGKRGSDLERGTMFAQEGNQEIVIRSLNETDFKLRLLYLSKKAYFQQLCSGIWGWQPNIPGVQPD